MEALLTSRHSRKSSVKVLWLLVSVGALSACGSQPAQVSYTVPVSFQSQHCYITQSESFIWLETESEWLALPPQSREQFEHTELDWIDENILIVSAGQKPSAGYGIGLSHWFLEQDHWHVTRVEHQPSADSMQAQMITSPCSLVKIPKSVKSFTLKSDQGRTLGRWPF